VADAIVTDRLPDSDPVAFMPAISRVVPPVVVIDPAPPVIDAHPDGKVIGVAEEPT
jgi:hypothetical protein